MINCAYRVYTLLLLFWLHAHITSRAHHTVSHDLFLTKYFTSCYIMRLIPHQLFWPLLHCSAAATHRREDSMGRSIKRQRGTYCNVLCCIVRCAVLWCGLVWFVGLIWNQRTSSVHNCALHLSSIMHVRLSWLLYQSIYLYIYLFTNWTCNHITWQVMFMLTWFSSIN